MASRVPTIKDLSKPAPSPRALGAKAKTGRFLEMKEPVTKAPTKRGPATQTQSTRAPGLQTQSMKGPGTQVSSPRAPGTQVITKQATKTQPPTTRAPGTQVTTKQAMKTQFPTTRAPATQLQTKQNLGMKSPTTRVPENQSSTTRAPATQPPITRPPTTKSLSTRVPSTKSPSSPVPATQPNSTRPPATKSLSTRVPSTKSPSSPVPATQPHSTRPPATKPPTTKVTTTQPPAIWAPATHPPVMQTSLARVPVTQIMLTRATGTRPYQFKEDNISCPICTKQFDQPRILPCLHTFCHNCLLKHIQDGRYGSGTKGFPCPCCRKLASLPEMTKTRPEKWAELFPINSLQADLVELNSLRKGTKVCDPCKKNKTKSEVHAYCKNCRDAMCENCSKTHRGLSSCKNHLVITTAQFEAAINSLKVEEEFCSKHEGKVMGHFCETHSKLCCSSCISEEHRQCNKVVSVGEAAQKCRESHEIPKLENALAKYKAHLDIILKNRSTQLKKLDNKKGKLMEEFLNVKNHIISQLEKMENDMKTKLEETHKQETKKIHGEVEKCQEIQSGVINAVEILEIAENHGANSQIIDTVEKVKHECCYYEEKIGGINGKVRNVDYDIALDKSLEQMLKKLNQFGRIDVKASPSGLPESPKIAGTLGLQSSTTKTKSVKPVLALTGKEANEIGEFNARSYDDVQDNTCWFTGAQFLQDGRILLADRTNRKLKLFSRDFSAVAELALSSKPWDLAVISDRIVAVSLPTECRIQFVAVSQSVMSTVRTIPTEEPCFGIHHANGKIMAVTYDGDPPNLKILSPEGEELTYVSVDEDGFTLFSKPIYVSSNSNGSEIYVTDERLGCVVNLTENGELNFTYSAMDLGHAAGITLDNDGNVYVCGNTSNSVHVLNSQGDRVKVLVNGENISYPRAIAFEPKEKKLLVTQGDKDVVKVYSLA